MLGDVGGLLKSLTFISQFFIYYIGSFGFETDLISKVFKYAKQSKDKIQANMFMGHTVHDNASNEIHEREKLSQYYFWSCKRDRWRQYLKVRKRVEKELDIVQILKNQTMFEAVLRLLFSKKERFFLRHHFKFTINYQSSGTSSGEDL